MCIYIFSAASVAVLAQDTLSQRSQVSRRYIIFSCAMRSVAERLADAEVALLQVKERYDAKGSQVISNRDEAIAILEHHVLIETVHKNVDKGGFHPRNRGKRGLTPSEVPKKLEKFKSSGFSAKVLKPFTVQKPPGQLGDTYENDNIALCNAKASAEMLAPVSGGIIDCFTLTCNHSWQAVRLAKHMGGCEAYKSLTTAIVDGITVSELPHQVETAHPWLVDLIIEADNVPQQIVVHDSTIDLCFKIRNLASELDNDWDGVQARMCRTEVKKPDDIPFLIEFVRSSCLLPSYDLLLDVDAYAKRMQLVQDIPARVLGKFESQYLGPSGSPMWRGAVWKACMRAPSKYITNNVNTYVNVNDVSKMGMPANLKMVSTAESILEQARTIASAVGCDKNDSDNLFDVLGVRLVAHYGKRPLIGEFRSMLAIAGEWFHQMTLLAKRDLAYLLPAGWQLPQQGANPNANTTAAKQPNCVSNISANTVTDEQIVAHMKLKGISIGTAVVEKCSKDVYTVSAIIATAITVVSQNAPNKQLEVLPTMFLSLYDKTKFKPEDRALQSIPIHYIYIYIYTEREI